MNYKSLNEFEINIRVKQLDEIGQLEVQLESLNQQIQNLDNEKIKIETEYVDIQRENLKS